MSSIPGSRSQSIGGLSPDAISSLFQAIGGLRNRRALLAMAACLIAAVLVGGLSSLLPGRLGGFGALLTGLVVLVAVYTGINAAGLLLMDQARGVPLRGLIDALVYGLLCIPKVIVLGLAFFLVALVVFLVLAIVFFVCKIPALGPFMFTFVFPLAVVISGVTLAGLMLCMFLALPAIWEGATITRAIAQSLAIVKSRLVETFLLLAVVGFLSFVVGLIVFGVLGLGLLPTMGLSASILGSGGGMGAGMGGGMGGPFGGAMGMMRGAGGAYAIAGGIGAGLLWAIAATLVSQVWLLGLNLVYLRVSEGLDANATEAALAQGLAEARRKTAEMGHKAKEAAERARDQARQHMASAAPAGASAVATPEPGMPTPTPAPTPPAPPPAAAAPTEPPAALACPSCRAAITTDDLFCGACGHRLK
jgi:hypothetical protein